MEETGVTETKSTHSIPGRVRKRSVEEGTGSPLCPQGLSVMRLFFKKIVFKTV